MLIEESNFVLDASALLAYLQGEAGSVTVQTALATGAVMNTANYAEVLSRLSDAGEVAEAVDRRLSAQGLIGGLLEVVELTAEDAHASPLYERRRVRMVCRWGIVPAWPPRSAWGGRS